MPTENPNSWRPVSAAPLSGPPHSSWDQARPNVPDASAQQLRIPQSAPPKQSRPWIAVLAGVMSVLVGVVSGYFLGRTTAGSEPAAQPSASASAGALPPFEAAQLAANKAKLDGELAGLAQPWLAGLTQCSSSADRGAIKVRPGESRRVTCRYGAAWLHFVVYQSVKDRDDVRFHRQALNLKSDKLAPGVRDPGRMTGGVTGSIGKVIEYATREADGRIIAHLSWEREADELAIMEIVTQYKEDLGSDWLPLRDLWQRHS